MKNYWSEIGIITKVILFLNILVYIVQSFSDISPYEYIVWLKPVLEGQVYRLITATFSHANFMHIFFNMMTLLIFSPAIEKHHGFGDYLIINIILIIFWSFISLGLYGVMIFVPEKLYGGSQYYFNWAIGYSGVLFAYIMLWCFIGEKQASIFGLFNIRKIYLPWIYLFVNQVLFPNVSFIGHLSGILWALMMRVVLFTNDEHLWGSGRHNAKVLVDTIRPYVFRYNNMDNNPNHGMREMRIVGRP